jgi:hypothetical protein
MSGFPRHFLEPAGELIELPFARECGGLVPGRCLYRDLRQRRFLIHGGDGAVKFEILSPFGKASGFQHRSETALLPDEGRGALRAEARRARQSIRWIAAQCDEIRHLFGRDPVALVHLLRPDARHLAGL